MTGLVKCMLLVLEFLAFFAPSCQVLLSYKIYAHLDQET